jgi:hypothetical protein
VDTFNEGLPGIVAPWKKDVVDIRSAVEYLALDRQKAVVTLAA